MDQPDVRIHLREITSHTPGRRVVVFGQKPQERKNDEDAFALGGNTIAVRIGRKRQSNADYFLRSQAEIDELLKLLVSQRPGYPEGDMPSTGTPGILCSGGRRHR